MNATTSQINELYDRIPRRHTPDNVKEINAILDEYEDLLRTIEAQPAYEKHIAAFFDDLDPIRAAVKKSTENKHSKKQKDEFFDEASGALKDTMEAVKEMYGDGKG